MRLYVDGDKIITPNTVFTLYFTLMFCLYTNTYSVDCPNNVNSICLDASVETWLCKKK